MGLYDLIYVPVPCPLCGSIIADGQTKDLDNMMDEYHIGSEIHNAKLRYITAIYDCKNSLLCLAKTIRYHNGQYHGFGVLFEANIAIIYGKLGNYYFDVELSKYLLTDVSDSLQEALDYLANNLNKAYSVDEILLSFSEADLDTLKAYLDKTFGSV